LDESPQSACGRKYIYINEMVTNRIFDLKSDKSKYLLPTRNLLHCRQSK